MSRLINWEEPISDSDRAWASQFTEHDERIRMNDQAFADSGTETLAGEQDVEVPPYEEWSKKELNAEITKRGLQAPAGKPTVADLATILQAHDDAEEEKAPAAAAATAA